MFSGIGNDSRILASGKSREILWNILTIFIGHVRDIFRMFYEPNFESKI